MGAKLGESFSPEEIEYMQNHPNDSYIPSLIACSAVTGFLVIFFLFARFLGRRLKHGRWNSHMSDWLLTTAVVFHIASVIITGFFTKYGGGRHIIYVTNIRMIQITSVSFEAIYAWAMAFMKLSVLSLYRAIFPSRRFGWCIWGLVAFTVSWGLFASIGAAAQCVPFSYAWDPVGEGHCIDFGNLQLAATICTIITDFVILLMPLPLVRKLNTSREKRRMLMFTFMMGGSACIVSIVRLYYSLKVGSLDGTWVAAPTLLISQVEVCVGILVVSIPTYRPLYRKIVYGTADSNTSPGISDPRPLAYLGFGKIGGNYGSHNSSKHRVEVSAGGRISDKREGISVMDDIELVRHAHRDGAWVRVSDETEDRATESVPDTKGTSVV